MKQGSSRKHFWSFRLWRPFEIDDREFLPAALEILEMPPSPIRMILIVSICTLFAGALLWSYTSRIDIIATAQGKLQPTGRVKVIQPLETGKVASINAHNGQHVAAGEVLVALDPSEAEADQIQLAASLASAEAETIRRKTALAAASGPELIAPRIEFPDAIPMDIKQREQRVLDADMAQLAASVASLLAQRNLKQAEYNGLTKMIIAQKELLDTQHQRVDMRTELMSRAAGSKSTLIDATETMQIQLTSLAQQEGQLAQAEAGMAMAERDVNKTLETFLSENSQKLADVERQVDETRQKYAKAAAKLGHMRLAAPITGIVQGSIITSINQVVTVGQELMRIVPDDEALEIEAYLPNRDISFVREGQKAVIKIEAFPFTQYGTIEAIVTRVGRDSIPEPDAQQNEENPSKPTQMMSFAGAQRVQNLVFPITLKPTNSSIEVEGLAQTLSAGMAVTAEIHTGSRRILEYVFSPVLQASSTALHER